MEALLIMCLTHLEVDPFTHFPADNRKQDRTPAPLPCLAHHRLSTRAWAPISLTVDRMWSEYAPSTASMPPPAPRGSRKIFLVF